MRGSVLLTFLVLGGAATSEAQTAPGPIRQAIARIDGSDVVRLPSSSMALPPGSSLQSSSWSRVMKLRPGTEIRLTTVDQRELARHVVYADEFVLTVLDSADPSLPGDAPRQLQRIAREHAAAFLEAQKNTTFVSDDVSVGPGGVFYQGRWVADVTSVVFAVPRSEVLQVSRFEKRGSRWVALIAGIAGATVGFQVGRNLAFRPCDGSCSDEQLLMWTSLVGLPVGTAALGYFATRRTVDVIGYRVPRP